MKEKSHKNVPKRAKYKGSIVVESLEDKGILDNLKVLNIDETDDEIPADRWHIYAVEATPDEINEISRAMYPERWYAHFWDNKNIVAVFRDKVFHMKRDDKNTWQEAINYGMSVGVPKEQLDFLTD